MILAGLRTAMSAHGLDLYLVPSSDEHLGEYVPPWRARRAFASGFTGSAGDLLVGVERAWLFTDGRYHEQARQELAGTGVELVAVGSPGSPTLVEHLAGAGDVRLGVDPGVLSEGAATELERALAPAGGRLVPVDENLVDPLWHDRPAPAAGALRPAPLEWTGESANSKVLRVRESLDALGAEALAVVKLDQIAWLLNLRARDEVPYNPVFEAFLHVAPDGVHLFLEGAGTRLPEGFELEGLVCHAYPEHGAFLEGRTGERVAVDRAGTTRGVVERLGRAGAVLVAAPSPIEEAKALKNEAEIEAMRAANLRASIAKTRALLWLRRRLAEGATVTEARLRERIESLYGEQPGFDGLSFATIAATGPHCAIVHYGGSDDTPVRTGELVLVDSGIHADGGTTDDTRTVVAGEADPEQRRVYTAVLRAHIRLAHQRFPVGTPGSALDALARAEMWTDGLVYDHGTGHGVGAHLNVHEGPFALAECERKPFAVHPLAAGMVTSVEPGHYRPGWGGVRLENLYLVVDVADGWLAMESLTWIPFDPVLVDRGRLLPRELEWLDRYQAACVERLAPHLEEGERVELDAWLGG